MKNLNNSEVDKAFTSFMSNKIKEVKNNNQPKKTTAQKLTDVKLKKEQEEKKKIQDAKKELKYKGQNFNQDNVVKKMSKDTAIKTFAVICVGIMLLIVIFKVVPAIFVGIKKMFIPSITN